ncbi:MAG: TlyA family RNA methyltransferase [Candidatus Aminicenantes bacterium]|nr:TlyA family RNA methyltransferase [Candidatus Aminicenantes bacterium]
MRERADRVMVSRGLAESRQKAQALIMSGVVWTDGRRVEKPGQLLSPDQKLSVKEKMPFVGRGGLKLAEALDVFRISPKGKTAADLGASTGGFTDCLLQRGARRVYAVDVDTRQLDWRLRSDERVILIEKNARYLGREDFADPVNLITLDLSFISLLKVLPAVFTFLTDGVLLTLIKPQFEVGRKQVGKKGIVRDPALHREILFRVIQEARKMGFFFQDVIKCTVRGQKGNREYFARWTLGGDTKNGISVEKKVEKAVYHE